MLRMYYVDAANITDQVVSSVGLQSVRLSVGLSH